jgi:hypothetical protein
VSVILDPEPVFALAVDDFATEGNYQVDVTVTDSSPSLAPYAISVNGGSYVNFSGFTYAVTGLNWSANN